MGVPVLKTVISSGPQRVQSPGCEFQEVYHVGWRGGHCLLGFSFLLLVLWLRLILGLADF